MRVQGSGKAFCATSATGVTLVSSCVVVVVMEIVVVAAVMVVTVVVVVVVVKVIMVNGGCTFDNFMTSSESNFSASRKGYDVSERYKKDTTCQQADKIKHASK
jgi:hypothetical protein